MVGDSQFTEETETPDGEKVRVLLLDDEPITLIVRAAILRKNGYVCLSTSTYEEAVLLFNDIDIAVLDYHLGAGKFGSDVAAQLRATRPDVPIIILSATLEHFFGGAEDMHLLKGYSSNDNLLAALQSLEAKRRGAAVVSDPSQFFYSRIAHAIGPDSLLQIFDAEGRWLYCNEEAADFLGHEREWFPGRSLIEELPHNLHHWQRVILDVASRRETYMDRTRHGLLHLTEPLPGETSGSIDTMGGLDIAWTVMAFPIALPDGRTGVALTARAFPPSTPLFA